MAVTLSEARAQISKVLTDAGIKVDDSTKGRGYGLNGLVWVLPESTSIDGAGAVFSIIGAVTQGADLAALADRITDAMGRSMLGIITDIAFTYGSAPIGREGIPEADFCVCDFQSCIRTL